MTDSGQQPTFPEPPDGLLTAPAGGLALTVPADDEAKVPVARILGSHGDHDMAHFAS